MARVILDPLAETELLHHFEIETSALLQPLRFEQLAGAIELLQALDQFQLDRLDRIQHHLARRHIVGLGEDIELVQAFAQLAGQGIELADALDLVVEQLDPDRLGLGIAGKDVDHLAAHPVGAAAQLEIVARVLHLGQPAQNHALLHHPPDLQRQAHLEKARRVTQAVDRRHAADDQRIGPLQQRLGCRQPHLLDMLVDRGVLLDEGVRGRHVGLGLVVVVVAHEVLHGVLREETGQLAEKLRRQGLVVAYDQGGKVHFLYDRRHGVGLSRTCNPKKGLPLMAPGKTLQNALYGLRLVPGGFEGSLQCEAGQGYLRLSRDISNPATGTPIPQASSTPGWNSPMIPDDAPFILTRALLPGMNLGSSVSSSESLSSL